MFKHGRNKKTQDKISREQLSQECLIFGPGNASSMITVRLHPEFRRYLNIMAQTKKTSLNILIRKILMKEIGLWLQNKEDVGQQKLITEGTST